MRSFWSVSYAYSLVAAIACVVLFVVALIAAGAFWVLMARDDRRRRG